MKRLCPSCSYTRAWHLADGRFKCRRCNKRYSWTSAWDSCRLTSTVKRRLLELFVLGVPAYRISFRITVSKPSIERFFRLIRSALAHHEGCGTPFRETTEFAGTTVGGNRGGKRGRRAADKTIVLRIARKEGKIMVFPFERQINNEVIMPIHAHKGLKDLSCKDNLHIHGTFTVRGNNIVVSKEPSRPKNRSNIGGIAGFWSYAKYWLYPYRGIPVKFFHLYIGEILFRFNHRNKDLFPLIYRVMRHTSIDEIQYNLVR